MKPKGAEKEAHRTEGGDDLPARYVEALRRALGDELAQVSLFGSRARGDARPGSDYDFLVVSRGRRSRVKDVVYGVGGDFLAEEGIDVSAKVVSEEEFRRLRSSAAPFWERFRRDEVRLWPEK